tara:strand:- start:4399 stop:4920 length:522 start_codon:yes stop_codon:yes gene_type:complete
MPQPTAYLTRTEITTLLALELPSSDPHRAAWTAASSGDQDVYARMMTEDIDACAWTGARAEGDQQLAWPRVHRVTGDALDSDPDEVGDESVLSLPRDFRRAGALQAAYLAYKHAGLDPTAHMDEATRRGVVSQSGGGASYNLDMGRASNAWARLTTRAQRLLSRWRLRGGAIV